MSFLTNTNWSLLSLLFVARHCFFGSPNSEYFDREAQQGLEVAGNSAPRIAISSNEVFVVTASYIYQYQLPLDKLQRRIALNIRGGTAILTSLGKKFGWLVTNDGRLLEFSLQSGKITEEYPGKFSGVSCIANDEDGKALLIGFFDGHCVWISGGKAKDIPSFTGRTAVTALALSQEKKLAVIGNLNRNCAVIDLAKSRVRAIKRENFAVRAVAYDRRLHRFLEASGGTVTPVTVDNRTIFLEPLELFAKGGEMIEELVVGSKEIYVYSLSKVQELGESDRTIKIEARINGKTLSEGQSIYTTIAVDSDSSTAAFIDNNSKLKIIHLAHGRR